MCLVRVTLLVASAFMFVIAPRAETITIPSVTHPDLRFVSVPAATGVSVDVPGNLDLPQGKRDRYPTVVIAHAIGGWSEKNEGWFASELRKAGFATLGYDSFKPRGFGNTTGGGAHIQPAVVADAFAALNVLATHPKVDTSRIAIIGFSLGGDTAHIAAFEQVRTVVAPRHRFAAHVAFIRVGPSALRPAPELIPAPP